MASAAFALQILEASDFDAIRVRIASALDADALPDSVIDLYGPEAESEVLARDPNALTYQPGGTAVDAVKWTRVRRATIYITAARICGAITLPISERLGSYQYNLSPWDAAKRAAELRGLAEKELAAYLEVDGHVRPLFSFGVACGSRGR